MLKSKGFSTTSVSDIIITSNTISKELSNNKKLSKLVLIPLMFTSLNVKTFISQQTTGLLQGKNNKLKKRY